jgi:hypothetical protein
MPSLSKSPPKSAEAESPNTDQPRRGEQRDRHLLRIYDDRPERAALPITVAAAILGISDRTIRRNFKLIPVSDGRVGVLKSELLRSQGEVA